MYHSFELSPDTPVDFDGGEADYLATHKGISREQAQQMLERVTGRREPRQGSSTASICSSTRTP